MNSDPDVVCIESDPEEDVCIIADPKNTAADDVVCLNDSGELVTNASPELVIVDPEPGTSSSVPAATVKRIQPTLISSAVTSPTKKKEFGKDDSPEKSKKRPRVPKGDFGSFKRTRIMKLNENALDLNENSDDEVAPKVEKPSPVLAPEEKITKEFRQLIQTCKRVDGSVDMDKCIRKKLVGYYREVPPDFVNSKSFRDLVTSVVAEIKKSPHLIYLKLNRIVDELKPRRGTVLVKQEVVEGAETQNGNGDVDVQLAEKNAKKAAQIKKLNKALVQLKKRIDELDQEEVNWDEDMNSAHMKVERYKKRACQIYEKLCDISGESKHAQRSLRKPIKFHGTVYPEFNKTLQAFVNRTNIFPDYFDVKKCLEHCNKQYDMKLRPEEIKVIAQDAFVKVGKILQKRRKIDLYETISYFVGTEADPADEDANLLHKLVNNKQHHSKISDLIDKFAEEQGQKGDEDVDDDDGDDNDQTDPMSMVAADMSMEENDDDPPLSNSIADPTSTVEVKSDVIEIVDSQPLATPINGSPSDVKIAPVNAETSLDTDNLDETIDYIVSNNIDPFAIPETDLLQEFPISIE